MTKHLDTVQSPEALRTLPEEALPALCEELRQDIIALCGRVGGHLGASLGAVELIVALHRVFKSPTDRIVFDVGHQAYAHKLLSGRRARMDTLRQAGGVAPFLDPSESVHDASVVGHACTAISSALGLLEAKRALGKPGRVVAVVGDGAFTGGLTFEGLNNALTEGEPLVIVLNDNQMSISVNVGAISSMLRSGAARAFFESMGLTYLGPVDGHDLPALLQVLRDARNSRKPVLVHARTQKGKGFSFAEEDEKTRGHAMGPYELRDGKLVRSRGGKTTFSEAFAQSLEVQMEKDPRVVVVTPAMLEGSALVDLQSRFPKRVFDVGIAEQHAVTFSAGLAAGGLRPVCCIYSTFLQRAYDQVIHDVCIPKLPVIFAVDRAGLVGADGATHQGAYDLAFLRPLPGMTVSAAVVGEDLSDLLVSALQRSGPSVIRFPRGTLPSEQLPAGSATGARWLKQVDDAELSIIGVGPLVLNALEAAKHQPRWSVLDARFVSPLDGEAVLTAARSGRVLTVEEGTLRGGLGSAVLEILAETNVRVHCLGLPDQFIPHGDARVQRTELGLSTEGIVRAAKALLT